MLLDLTLGGLPEPGRLETLPDGRVRLIADIGNGVALGVEAADEQAAVEALVQAAARGHPARCTIRQHPSGLLLLPVGKRRALHADDVLQGVDNMNTNLIIKLLEVTREHNFQYAVGGGVAVNAYGYRRETEDVDAFFLDEDRVKVLRAFRASGMNVRPIFEPFHYAAFLPDARSVDERIDLMFPVDDPDVSAIEMAQETGRIVQGCLVRIFPVELLVLAKSVYSDRMEDKVDVLKLYRLGAWDPVEARRLLTLMDEGALPEFDRFVKALEAKTERRARPAHKDKPKK